MKRLAAVLLAASLLALSLSAADKSRKVLLNGKVFTEIHYVDGILVVPMNQLSKAAGGTFRMHHGEILATLTPPADAVIGEKIIGEKGSKPAQGTEEIIGEEGSQAGSAARKALKPAPKGAGTVEQVRVISAQHIELITPVVKIRREGALSSKMMMRDDTIYVPLTDVMKALGATYEVPPSKLAPTADVRIIVKAPCEKCILGIR